MDKNDKRAYVTARFYKILALTDIMDQYLKEIEDYLVFDSKMHCRQILRHSQALINDLQKMLPSDAQDQFGDVADYLRIELDKLMSDLMEFKDENTTTT